MHSSTSIYYCNNLFTDNIVQIFGEWKGATAAGSKDKFNSPKYILKVPKSG